MEDKFYVMRYLYDAVDKVRRQEHRELKAAGDDRHSKTKRGFQTFSNYRIAILFHRGRLDLKTPATHSVS